MAIWSCANRLAFAHTYQQDSNELTDKELIQWDSLKKSLPKKVSQSLTKPNYKQLVKYLVIKDMFENGSINSLSPDYVSKNFDLFLECSFMKKIFVGERLSRILKNQDEVLIFLRAIDQIDKAIENNFPDTKSCLKIDQSLTSKNPDEIILPMLFSILEKNFPEDEINFFKENNNLFYGTAYYTYAFLLYKWIILSAIPDFYNKSLREKQRHLIFDRGAGNDTAFTSEQIQKITNIDTENANEAILEIVRCEQFDEDGYFGGDMQKNWDKFLDIAPEIKNKTMQIFGIESID